MCRRSDTSDSVISNQTQHWIPIFLAISTGVGAVASLVLSRLYDRIGIWISRRSLPEFPLFAVSVFGRLLDSARWNGPVGHRLAGGEHHGGSTLCAFAHNPHRIRCCDAAVGSTVLHVGRERCAVESMTIRKLVLQMGRCP